MGKLFSIIRQLFKDKIFRIILLYIIVIGIILLISYHLFNEISDEDNNDNKKLIVDNCDIEEVILSNNNLLVYASNNNSLVVSIDFIVDLYDSNDKAITSVSGKIENVFSKDKGYTEVYISEYEFDYYKINNVKVNKDSNNNVYNDIAIVSDEVNNNIFTIKLKNNTKAKLDVINYGILLYDKKDKIIGYSKGEVYDSVKPNGTVSTQAYVPSNKEMISLQFSRYEIVGLYGIKY